MPQRLRVGVNSLFLDPAYTGGVWTYLRNLMRELPGADPEVDYCIFASRESATAFDLGGAANACVISAPIRAQQRPLRLAYEYALLPLHVQRRRVAVLFSPAYTAPIRRQYASVVTIHDLRHEDLPETFSLGYRVALSSLTRRAARGATRIVTVSEYVKRRIVEVYQIPPERVTVTHLAADPIYSTRLDADVIARMRDTYGLNAPYIFSTAAPGHQKNLETLLDAFLALRRTAIPRVQLAISGLRPHDMATFGGMLPDGITQDVVPLGWVAGEDLPALYQGATAFAFPSRYEGFGLPVLEAMASGVPVVTTTATSLPEVAGGAALLVDPEDAAELAGALGRLVGDEGLRREMSGRGRERAAQFSWKKTAEETLAVFRNVRQRGT